MRTTLGPMLLTLSLVATALLASGSTAVAQPPGRWGGGSMGGGSLLPLIVRSANLTPDQEAKVKELVAARRASARSVMQQLRQAEDELAARMFTPGSVHLADVQPQLQRIAQLRDQLLRDSTQAAIDVLALLTPEQLARAAQTNERMRQLQREMRQLWQQGN